MKNEITPQKFIRSYWNYFIDLEEQLISTKRYVDFDKTNDNTFSIEYLKLLQATCSEIDVVAKIIAEYYDSSFAVAENKSIQKWGFVLQNTFKDLNNLSVQFNNDYDIVPWNNWQYEKYIDKKQKTRYKLKGDCKTPYWWTAYNKVKHERTSNYGSGQTNYMRANLHNLVSAMAALFLLETMFLSKLKLDNGCFEYQKSKLFIVND